MNQYIFVSAVIVVVAGCGGGGGHPDNGLQFGKTVPSEATLCSFTMGETTREQVETVLGPPTNFSDDDLGTSVQYWYGNAAVLADFRTMLLAFDESGIFESASLSQMPYPQCWRDPQQPSAHGT
jgi:hypothetical protein